jgi:hypothetical protein
MLGRDILEDVVPITIEAMREDPSIQLIHLIVPEASSVDGGEHEAARNELRERIPHSAQPH